MMQIIENFTFGNWQGVRLNSKIAQKMNKDNPLQSRAVVKTIRPKDQKTT